MLSLLVKMLPAKRHCRGTKIDTERKQDTRRGKGKGVRKEMIKRKEKKGFEKNKRENVEEVVALYNSII